MKFLIIKLNLEGSRFMKEILAKAFSVTIVICLLIQAAVLAAPAKEVLLEINNGQETHSSGKLLVIDDQLLVPVAVIKDEIYHNTYLDSDNHQLIFKFVLPRVKVGDKVLDKMLFSSVNLALPYRMIEGKSYVDANQASKMLGFTLAVVDNKATIKINQYSSFSPQILDKPTNIPDLHGQKVQLAWQPTFEDASNLSLLPKQPGLNVVSPSWFAIIDSTGLVQNKADAAYVKRAHDRGYQVWALITNSFNPDLTQAVLYDEKARQNVIKQLLIYIRLYEIDGINLDFENIYDRDKIALTNFVTEISKALKTVGATVSIDVTVPSKISQWSTCYERDKIGEVVDYVMVMAYDEHWRTSPVSGSVASIGWVENGIINTLKEVPAEKVVLGVPFYMREWQENIEGDKQVKARTMTMMQAEQTIHERNLNPQWLDSAGQYYFEYKENDKLYRVWQEDRRSLQLKVDLVAKYNLAGVAAWRKGFEKPEVWPMLTEDLGEKQLAIAEVQPSDKKLKKKHKK